jgi:hypothetical protein
MRSVFLYFSKGVVMRFFRMFVLLVIGAGLLTVVADQAEAGPLWRMAKRAAYRATHPLDGRVRERRQQGQASGACCQ